MWARSYPRLGGLWRCGIQRPEQVEFLGGVAVLIGLMEDLRDPAHSSAAETTIAVLVARGGADIVTVSSGIVILPFPLMPAYGASKAGVHSHRRAIPNWRRRRPP